MEHNKKNPLITWYIMNFIARIYFNIEGLLNYPFLKHKFLRKNAYPLNLYNPRTHNERIQYRKIFDRLEVHKQISDKIYARKFVDHILGSGSAKKLMVPHLAIVSRFSQLNPELNQQDIIIKASHGSGWNIKVKAGSKQDWKIAKWRSLGWLSRVHGVRSLEWAYRDLTPKLLVEKLLPENKKQPLDFKIYCYNGHIGSYMWEDNTGVVPKWTIFDKNYQQSGDNSNHIQFIAPIDFKTMQTIAKKLSKNFAMLRVDFLIQEKRWYLGELTLYDASGMSKYDSWEDDFYAGEFWGTDIKSILMSGKLEA